MPRNAQSAAHEGAPIAVGESDGVVEFDFPAGVSLTNQVTLMVVVDHVGTHTAEDTSVVVLDE